MKMIKIILVSCIGVLVVTSISLNVILSDKAISYYKSINLLKLDPLESTSLRKIPEEVALKRNGPLVILFGDSRVAGWQPTLNLPGCTLINRGISGQTTKQLILRLEKDVLFYSPDFVVLQAGINDLKNIGLFPRRKEDIILSCKENLFKITKKIGAQQIEIIVLTIFPTGEPGLIRSWFWSPETNAAIREVNEYLKTFLDKLDKKVHIVDVDPFLSDGQYVKVAFKKDMLHLNHIGYKKLNDFLQPYLVNLLNLKAS